MPSDRARRLIEALHEPHSLEARWGIADRFLEEERDEVCAGLRIPRMSDPSDVWRRFYQNGASLISERINQTRRQNGEAE